ncbi:STAS domain-containing protein [Ottowia sp. GY511]|uniref:STAS domain-containing protein n=1 Tax=Ottowia flava TaxID=2675430 RepID=A0ABW4KPZ2_9BURK|nr:STAS domain-containing protein [Ottowia sp. GY511]TXK32897.1 STAS domain-containing protein [Ottowia sp. GY511]
MSKDSGTRPGGLLSKMVKFVTSPTTHWSDLDRPDTDSGDAESRLALKEMIVRKRRNDFVRNREFDMLRKLRRRGDADGREVQASPSFYPSSQPANTGERARTLKKIDEIEAQMSTAWFKHKAGAAAAPGAAAEVTPGAVTAQPQPLPMQSAAAEPEVRPVGAGGPPQVRAFVPTETMGEELLNRPPAPTMPDLAAAPMPAALGATVDTSADSRSGVVLFGGHADFNVEVVVEAKQDPEIEEAAIRFANGDVAGAEAGLMELLRDGGSRHRDMDTWLTLFDLYRASLQQDKFDDAAIDFADLFGRSAPQWALVTEAGAVSAPAPITPPAAVVSGLFHWVSPSTIGTQSVAALKASLQRNPPPWRVDWRHLKTIEPTALPGLIDVLKRWGNQPGGLKFLGDDRLLAVLAERSPTDDREADPQWWDARLALLRLQREMDEFELVALNYCVTYEVSPPAWEEPAGSFNRMTEEGQTVVPSDFGPDATGESQLDSAPPSTGAPSVDEAGVFRGTLEGELVGAADQALAPFADGRGIGMFELNCRKLLRVDFGAAGDLLNWAMQQKSEGRPVTFKQVNRLVAAFFGVIGIQDAARVLPRSD